MNDYQLLENPASSEIEKIHASLAAYNNAAVEPLEKYAFAIMVWDDQQCFLGGIYCDIARNWLYIDELTVREAARNQKIGSELLARAENIARARDCHNAWLRTYSFQARPFYEKHGYAVFATLDDFPADYQCFFMQKAL